MTDRRVADAISCRRGTMTRQQTAQPLSINFTVRHVTNLRSRAWPRAQRARDMSTMYIFTGHAPHSHSLTQQRGQSTHAERAHIITRQRESRVGPPPRRSDTMSDTHTRARVASVARLQNVQLQMERINPKSMRPRSESSGLNPCGCVRGVAHA